MEDIPSQPRRWDRLNGSLRRSDTLVSAALRLAHSVPRPASNLMVGSDGTPDRQMDGPATHRSLRLGMDAEIHRPRFATGSTANFSPAGFVPWAFATGQLRPSRHGRIVIRNGWLARSGGNVLTMSSSSATGTCAMCSFLIALLQQRADTSLSEKGCAAAAGCSGRRAHCPDTHAQRITPLLCSDFICDRDRDIGLTYCDKKEAQR